MGTCYMQPLDIGYKETKITSYCSDYLNRKKGNKKETLDEWLLKQNIK